MIQNRDPLSSSEAIEIIKKNGKEDSDLAGFLKNFVKIDLKKAQELKEKLKGLDIMKLKKEQIVKIIDIMPESAEDLNKIFTDMGLDENETKSVLDTIKEFK